MVHKRIPFVYLLKYRAGGARCVRRYPTAAARDAHAAVLIAKGVAVTCSAL